MNPQYTPTNPFATPTRSKPYACVVTLFHAGGIERFTTHVRHNVDALREGAQRMGVRQGSVTVNRVVNL
jgi:hypothetical protein